MNDLYLDKFMLCVRIVNLITFIIMGFYFKSFDVSTFYLYILTIAWQIDIIGDIVKIQRAEQIRAVF